MQSMGSRMRITADSATGQQVLGNAHQDSIDALKSMTPSSALAGRTASKRSPTSPSLLW